MAQDIRKWFVKQNEKGNISKQAPSTPATPALLGVQESSRGRKTSKYFAKDGAEDEMEVDESSAGKNAQKGRVQLENNMKPQPGKKTRKLESDGEDEDFFTPSVEVTPSKKLKSSYGEGDANKDDKDDKYVKPGGRGRGGRGRGGGGRGGFSNFGERKDPPHKGEKEVPEGAANCLDGSTFVISGTLDSLEREEAEDLIKRHGGRVTGSVSKKTSYLLCDEDIAGRKSAKAKELGTPFLTEDGLFDMIRASNKSKKPVDKDAPSPPKKSPQKSEKNKAGQTVRSSDTKGLDSVATSSKPENQPTSQSWLPWTERYRPKVLNDIVGNQSLVKQLHGWLEHWNEQFLNTGKKQNHSGAKKAVLLSGTPGIGKTTSAKLVSQMLGFQTVEVNASDSRGKADGKIGKGIGGSTSNSIKELVSNETLSFNMERSQHSKTVLIMDEVDGMSAGDRGGVADLIASIKISKIPIICICNDRYSQKLKSLVNYCLLLNFRKPTKQQISKRLSQIANAEGLQVNEIALEELAERTNGDIRMALNHLHYMSLSMSVIKFDDIKRRLQSSSKDEDISPFTAVDKLFGFNSGKLRMNERIDLSMSDPDLIPLLIQENYINYRPNLDGKDDNGMKRMSSLAQAAESIADGDIINIQIRRHGEWELSQIGCLSSCIIPAALLHGQREILEQGERNFNRFGGWLGKNSSMGKNYRLLEDLHVHILASRESNQGPIFFDCMSTLRLDYSTTLLKRLTDPLRGPKVEAVKGVMKFMKTYSISMDDYDTIMELSKFKGLPNPVGGIQPAVKAALTKAYNKGSSLRVIRSPKKRAAPNKEESVSDADEELEDDSDDPETEKLQSDLLSSKGIQVEGPLSYHDLLPPPIPVGSGGGGPEGEGFAFATRYPGRS